MNLAATLFAMQRHTQQRAIFLSTSSPVAWLTPTASPPLIAEAPLTLSPNLRQTPGHPILVVSEQCYGIYRTLPIDITYTAVIHGDLAGTLFTLLPNSVLVSLDILLMHAHMSICP